MRKEYLKAILKETKKDEMRGVPFIPTLEECEYLASKGVSCIKSISRHKTIVGSYDYITDTFDFVLEK